MAQTRKQCVKFSQDCNPVGLLLMSVPGRCRCCSVDRCSVKTSV